jgi:nicotinamide-nucleotide amidase
MLMSNEWDSEASAFHLLELCRSARLKIATAESCTGGLVAAAITDIPGASDVFERGFVTYSNAAKVECLGVAKDVMLAHGAVSAPTARAMALGALANSSADLAVSITGVAGPGGGTAEKPVGLVHFACARAGRDTTVVERRFGPLERREIRRLAVLQALQLLIDAAQRRP